MEDEEEESIRFFFFETGADVSLCGRLVPFGNSVDCLEDFGRGGGGDMGIDDNNVFLDDGCRDNSNNCFCD